MTSKPKNVHIDKLDDIVNKYNNKYHRTIKMNPVDVKSSIYFDFNKEHNKEGLKFKVDDHVRISKYKRFLQKAMFQIDLKKFLGSKKLRVLCHGHMLLVTWTVEKMLERFIKKNCKEQINKSLELKK